MLFDVLLLALREKTAENLFIGHQSPPVKRPQPDLLLEAMNRLSLAFVEGEGSPCSFPRTMQGFIALCHRRTGEWWPRANPSPDMELPAGFNKIPLLDDGVLSEEASERLDDAFDAENLPTHASAQDKKSGLQNAPLRDLIGQLRGVRPDQAEQANDEYRLVRRFLIKNPLPTKEQIHSLYLDNNMHLVSPSTIGSFYEDSAGGADLWVCDDCGPLLHGTGKLLGLKPRACRDHWENSSHVRKIKGEDALHRRRLKRGLHLRTLIPGIPELNLFDWLEHQAQEAPELLCVTLWPGVDRYDFRLQWNDGKVWGVDFKDYTSPENLGRKLKEMPNEGEWSHDTSIYVFPSRHIERNPDYGKIALNHAQGLPSEVHLWSDTHFKERVQERLSELKKAKRTAPKTQTKEDYSRV